MQLLDWVQVEKQLFEMGRDAIIKFGLEHPEETCSFFAYSISDNPYGGFELGFDTLANSIKVAREREVQVSRERESLIYSKQSWPDVQKFIRANRIYPMNLEMGYFAYYPYAQIRFDNWEDYAYEDKLPPDDNNRGDYLINNSILKIWKVCEQLVEEQYFNRLKLTSPFCLGYQLDEEEKLIIVKVINWPNLEGESN